MGRPAQAFTQQTPSSEEPSELKRRRISRTRKSKMKLSSALGLALVLAIVLLLVVPESESKSIRPHRGALARRAMGMGGGRGMRSKKARRGKNGRRRGRQDEIPEADVVSDDAGSGDGGDVCEVLMFDRGDGTYSLKFVQNKCE